MSTPPTWSTLFCGKSARCGLGGAGGPAPARLPANPGHAQALPPSKVPRFYLLDSIVKNHRNPYAELFAARIVPTFCDTYDSVRAGRDLASGARVAITRR